MVASFFHHRPKHKRMKTSKLAAQLNSVALKMLLTIRVLRIDGLFLTQEFESSVSFFEIEYGDDF